MKYLAVAGLLFLSSMAMANITSPPNGQKISGSTVEITWEGGADKYWVLVQRLDGHKLQQIGNIVGTSTVIDLPQNDSEIQIRLWRFEGSRWHEQSSMFYRSMAAVSQSTGVSVIENYCNVGADQVGHWEPVIVKCEVTCPNGMVATAAEAVTQLQRFTGGNQGYELIHDFSTFGLGSQSVELILESPPDMEYFHGELMWTMEVTATAICQ